MPGTQHIRTALAAIVGLIAASSPAGAQSVCAPSAVVTNLGVAPADVALTLGVPDHTVGTFGSRDSVTYRFIAPLDNVPGTDLLLWAFVDNNSPLTHGLIAVDVRTSPDSSFTRVADISTAGIAPDDLHARIADGGRGPYIDFPHVHAFSVDFGALDKVTEVRVTNTGLTDLGVDALEAIHPAFEGARHAVELRIFRRRDDFSKRFALRFKNIGSVTDGVEMSGFTVGHTSQSYIDQTSDEISGANNGFLATPETTAGPDNGPTTQSTDYEWTLPGRGLPPGDIATHVGWATIDTDQPADEFLEHIVFTLRFVDGAQLYVDYTDIVAAGVSGQIFSLYQFPPSEVSLARPRPTFYINSTDAPLVAQDPFPPTVPANLVATGGDREVQLVWGGSTDDRGVQAYVVERSNGFDFAEVATVLATSTSYTDSGLLAGTTYLYRVRARDVSNNLSDSSVVVAVSTNGADTSLPTAPSMLAATVVADTQVDLTWVAGTDDVGVVDYVVERALGDEDFVETGAVPAAQTAFTDRGLPPGSALRYRVRTRDAALNSSPYSNVATAMTGGAQLDAGTTTSDGGSGLDAGLPPTPVFEPSCRCARVPTSEAAWGLLLVFGGVLGARGRRRRPR